MYRSVAKSEGEIKKAEGMVIGTVDVGKMVNVGYCRYGRCELNSFEFVNNGVGFNIFWNKMKAFAEEHGCNDMIVGIESTGGYGEPFLHYMMNKPVRLVQVNAKHTKRVKEIQDNSPNKTDHKDPKVIADIIELGRFLHVVIPKGPAAELRRLTHARERCLQRYNVLHSQLHALVFSIFPELIQILGDLSTRTAEFIIRHMVKPEDMVGYGLESLCKSIRTISIGQIKRERIETLYRAAGQSVGIREGTESIITEIYALMDEIRGINQFKKELEGQMETYLVQVPYSGILLTMRGLGKITLAGLIGEFGDFSQFRTMGELLKFAGLNLYEISSGSWKGRRRISKLGRPLIRKLLYFASLNVVRKGGIMHDRYRQYCERMPRIKALVAISRKLLCIMGALVRTGMEYREPCNEVADSSIAKAA